MALYITLLIYFLNFRIEFTNTKIFEKDFVVEQNHSRDSHVPVDPFRMITQNVVNINRWKS